MFGNILKMTKITPMPWEKKLIQNTKIFQLVKPSLRSRSFLKDAAYISALNFVWQKEKKNQQKFQQRQVEKQPPPGDVQKKKLAKKNLKLVKKLLFKINYHSILKQTTFAKKTWSKTNLSTISFSSNRTKQNICQCDTQL